jgi:hypothetical protein
MRERQASAQVPRSVLITIEDYKKGHAKRSHSDFSILSLGCEVLSEDKTKRNVDS